MKQIVAVVAGVVVAGLVIFGVEWMGHRLFPLPSDIDATDMESIKANAERIPAGAQMAVCLAWALGTLAGSFAATKIVKPNEVGNWSPFRPALIVGLIMMAAAIVNLVSIPSPVWMWIAGLVVFLPAAMIGWRLATDVSTLRIQQQVRATPDRVFQLASDFPNAAEHIAGITKVEMLTDGDVGTGTRFRETRVMFGKEAVEEMEVTEYLAGRSYTLEADSCGSHFCTQMTTEATGGGTLVTLETKITPTTTFAKLMSPMAALMMGPMKTCLQGDLLDLKKTAERDAG